MIVLGIYTVLSEPQFPHLQNGMMVVLILQGSRGPNKMEHIKHLAVYLAYNKYSVDGSYYYPTSKTPDEGQNRMLSLHYENILGNRRAKIKQRHNSNFIPGRPPQPFCPSFSVHLFWRFLLNISNLSPLKQEVPPPSHPKGNTTDSEDAVDVMLLLRKAEHYIPRSTGCPVLQATRSEFAVCCV